MIIEAALLTDDEKITACTLAKAAGADYVKTSTGFGPGGATAADVALMRRVVGEEMGVKAAGGVRDLEGLKAMVAAGATRIGASAGVRIVQESQGKQPTAATKGYWRVGQEGGPCQARQERNACRNSVRNSYAGWRGLARIAGWSSSGRKKWRFDLNFQSCLVAAGESRKATETGNCGGGAARCRQPPARLSPSACESVWAERRKSKGPSNERQGCRSRPC